MTNVPDPPTGANPPAHVDLADPDARAAWLAAMHESAADVIDAADDQTLPLAERNLGPREASRIIREAKGSIASLFASVGFVKGAASREEPMGEAHAAAKEHEGRSEVAALGRAALDIACAHTALDQDDALESMPLAGVLFLAMIGSPGERAEVDPPLLLALRSLRATVRGWTHGSVSLADFDLLGRRLDATIEIAKRGGMEGAP